MSAAITISWTDRQAKAVNALGQHLATTATDYAKCSLPRETEMGGKNCPVIGMRIVDGKVRTSGFASRPRGPLAGAPAGIFGPARKRRIRGAVTTPVVPR
jgi:hypothetical protein